MKRILPLAAIIASCSFFQGHEPIKDMGKKTPEFSREEIRRVAKEECTRMSREELVKYLYQQITTPKNLTTNLMPNADCKYYGEKLKTELFDALLILVATNENTDDCYKELKKDFNLEGRVTPTFIIWYSTVVYIKDDKKKIEKEGVLTEVYPDLSAKALKPKVYGFMKDGQILTYVDDDPIYDKFDKLLEIACRAHKVNEKENKK